MNTYNAEVVIVGGGLVGAMLALALSQQGIHVALVEKRLKISGSSVKNIALSPSSYHLLVRLGVWDRLSQHAALIKNIHISEQGSFGFARLKAEQIQQTALGYVVSENYILDAVYACIDKQSRIHCFMGSSVKQFSRNEQSVCFDLIGNNKSSRLTAQLGVVADGVRSELRAKLNITTSQQDHEQIAMVGQVCMQTPLQQDIAYERFTAEGPIAMLPMKEFNKYAFVWTLSTEHANNMMACSIPDQMAAFQYAFGYRVGVFTDFKHVGQYPLCSVVANEVIQPRIVVCGSAAHHLHPVAGQGLNLCFRDIAYLVDLIKSEKCQGGDLGHWKLLQQYKAGRMKDFSRVSLLTHSLTEVFNLKHPLFKIIRNVGLLGFDNFPTLKKQFIELASYGSTHGVGSLITRSQIMS